MTCFFCHGPAHPATGCAWSATAIACRRCTVDFWRWFRAMQHRRWGGQSFYEAAARKPEPSP